MPRLRRHVRPGALIHIIVRFTNHEYLLDTPAERAEYLRRARIAFRKSDWRPLSFALMSTHTHLGAIAGKQPFAELSRPLHAGFVGWLNPRRGRLGAGIASRPATHEVALEHCAWLLAYHHNNPVRAGVVAAASDSDWTSHRYYSGDEQCDWLDIGLGLELAGFDETTAGRKAFAAYVDGHKADRWGIRDDELAGIRRSARRRLGSSVELGQPRVGDRIDVPLWTPSCASVHRTKPVAYERIARAVARRSSITPNDLRSRDRSQASVRGRRLFVLVARYGGASFTEAAAFLGVSQQAASRLAARASRDEREKAHEIAHAVGVLWEKSCEVGTVP